MRAALSNAASAAAVRLLCAATVFGQASAVLRAGVTGGAVAGSSYNYALRGEDWTQGECADRERQSPVDFGNAAPWDCGPNIAAPSVPGCYIGAVHFEYNVIDGNLSLRPGSTALGLEAAGKGYGGLTYDGRWFNLLSVNFHAGSEHTFHGQRLSLEMHLVHKEQDDGQVLVLAVPFEAAAAMQGLLAPGPAPGPMPKPCPPSPPPTPVPGPKLPEIRERIKQIGFPPSQGAESDRAAVGSALAGTAVVEDIDWEETAQWSYSRPGPSPSSLFQQVQRGRLRAGRAAAGRQDPGSSPLLQKLFVESFPASNGALEVAVGPPTDFFNPLVEGGTFFEYAGSLTVPPCVEEVTWLVRREPLVASALQATKLHEAVAAANGGTENWRSTMPLLGRRIYVRDAQRGKPPLATPSPEEQEMQQRLQEELRGQDQNMQGTVNDAYLFKGAKMGAEAMAWAYAADQNYMNIALGLGLDPSNPSTVTRGATSASPSAAPSSAPPGAVSER